METKIIISVCFITIFIICGVFLYKWLKKYFNKKLYIYPKTGHLYLLIYRCKLKCPSTGKWFDAIIYKGVEDERYYVRERKDFFDKFVKLNNRRIGKRPVLSDNVEQFMSITQDMAKTYAAKNHDYGNSFEESLNEFGLIASVVRLGDKMNRIKSLIKKEAQVKDESIKDTLLDMANYAIMTITWMNKN